MISSRQMKQKKTVTNLSVFGALMVTFMVLVLTGLTGCTRPRQVPATVSEPEVVALGGGAGDAGGGSNERPTFGDMRSVLAKLSLDLEWAYVPLSDFNYEDKTGGTHKEMQFTKDVTPELHSLLKKIRSDILQRNDSGVPIEFAIKEHGACVSEDGNQEASAKKCDRESPICISLEYVQKMTPKASLETSLTALVMHEIAHQNCAEEKEAKAVERFYSQEAVINYKQFQVIGGHFETLRQNLELLNEYATKGHRSCEDGTQKIIPKTSMCVMIGGMSATGEILKEQIATTSIEAAGPDGPAQHLNESLRAIEGFCNNKNLGASAGNTEELNRHLIESIDKAKSNFDSLAETFSTGSGYQLLDFSKRLFPSSILAIVCP